MPFYTGALGSIVPVPSTISPVSVTPGESVFLFGVQPAPPVSEPVPNDSNVVAEAVGLGTSIAALLAPVAGKATQGALLEFTWTSNPGAATILIQEADTDADGHYITPSNATYTVSAFTQIGVTANYKARADVSPTGGRFLRVQVSANPNAASLIAKLTAM